MLVLFLYGCEAIAAITGIYYWRKIKNSYWKWFAVYLIVIVFIETTGRILQHLQLYSWNLAFFTWFGIPVQFLFFYWLYGKQQEIYRARLPVIAAVIYIASILTEVFLIKGRPMWFFSFSYTVGTILLVVLIITYLLKFVNSDAILAYKSDMMFWVSAGLAIFCLGTLPFFALRNTLYYQYRDVFIIYNYIQLVLDCLMYLVFALLFIWGKPKSSYF